MNNLKRYNFVICLLSNDLMLHRPRHDFATFGSIYENVDYFPAIVNMKKENKVNKEDLRDRCLTTVKSDPKAPFSIATTPRCRGWRHSFLWIAPLYPP